MEKDLKNRAIEIKGKLYVQVKDRIAYLDEVIKDYSITTEYQYYQSIKTWVVKATLTFGGKTYNGTAQEVESDNFKDVNFSSALENAETSAVGRACAFANIGIVDSIASADEMNKAINRGSVVSSEPADGGVCKHCGAKMKLSIRHNKYYCSALCWKNKEEPKKEDNTEILDSIPF